MLHKRVEAVRQFCALDFSCKTLLNKITKFCTCCGNLLFRKFLLSKQWHSFAPYFSSVYSTSFPMSEDMLKLAMRLPSTIQQTREKRRKRLKQYRNEENHPTRGTGRTSK